MSRRMFSDEITSTDAFLDLPKGSQLLYFHLGMSADDDGFVANPKMIMRVIGSSEDELKVLFAKKFLLAFDNGVCVVKHWRINNYIRKDIYKETKYINEKNSLFIRENGSYSFNPDGALPLPKGHFTVKDTDFVDASCTSRALSIGKVRLGKVSKDKESIDTENFNTFWNLYPNKTNKKKSQEIWDSKQLDSKLKEILVFIEKAKETERWQKGFIKAPDVFLRNESWTDDLSAYGKIKKETDIIKI
jgi:hypothetical protein